MNKISGEKIIIKRSEDPEKDFLYTPSILRLPSGRLLVSLDISNRSGQIYLSDDGGLTWELTAERLFRHARLFSDGKRVYLLGHYGDLIVYYSDDEGKSWSGGEYLTSGESWHQSACSVWYKDGFVYLVMEKRFLKSGETFGEWWAPNILAPVMMRGRLGFDLTKRENWLFSDLVRFRDVIADERELDWFGIPFYQSFIESEGRDDITWSRSECRERYDFASNTPGIGFTMEPSGWLETNVVQITDPAHYWFDPSGKTLHMFMRAHTGGTGYCCVMKAVERTVGGMEVINIEPVTVPSGRKQLFLPMPGGQMKFYVKYDDKTKLYWLLSTQAVDSMRRIEYLDDERYNIPCDERNRLTLHYSANMVDWCFAGLVDKGDSEKQSRHYGSMDIDGDDLVIVSRSGDADAKDAHCGNLITFHRVRDFRELVY